MISLQGIVHVVIYLLVAAAILGLLWFLIGFCEKNLGGPPMVYNVLRVVFVILVVLILIAILLVLLLIGLLLSFVNGQPLFRT